MAEWLNTFPWNFVGHYTFMNSYSIDGATKAFQDYLWQYPPCFSYFSVEEQPRGHVHVHALIGRVENMNVLPWGLGWYEFTPFDKNKGAAWYVSKCPQEWQLFGGFPKEKPANADRWWRPGTTTDPAVIERLLAQDK